MKGISTAHPGESDFEELEGINRCSMNPSLARRIMMPFLCGAICFVTFDTWARLPKPYQENGVALAVDVDTQTLVFKPGNGRKPLLVDWNKDTEFSQDGNPSSAAQLKPGTSISIHYKDVSFHNPLLKKVMWTSASAPK